MARKEAVVNFCDRWVLSPILGLVMRQHQLQKHRREVVAATNRRVLEVGVGSELNFSLYGKQVEIVFGTNPSARLLAIARRRAAAAGVRAEFLQGSATAIPFANNRHGGDDLDVLFDRGPIGRITREGTSPQAGRQAALRSLLAQFVARSCACSRNKTFARTYI